jgi:glycosyltransferase involved in cell wall biosynthesis
MPHVCDLVLPCRDEAAALPGVLTRVPSGVHAIVVDNGSVDDTAAVATELGAQVVREASPGYGAAVHAGVAAAAADVVAVMDGDGSLDPAQLPELLAAVLTGSAHLAVGRRRPAVSSAWPWYAQAANALAARRLRRCGVDVHDIGPMRVCRRSDLLDLAVEDRRYGYPVELLRRAGEAGWVIREYDVSYFPRAAGTKSKVTGSFKGRLLAARDFARQLP